MKNSLLKFCSKKITKRKCYCLLIAILFIVNVHAQSDIARWTYEPLQGTSTAPTPNTGSGSSLIVGSMSGPGTGTGMSGTGCGSQVTGTTAWAIGTANPGSSNESSGVQYNVSTVGYSGISFTWDQRYSNTAPNTLRLQYTTDGTAWTNFTMTSGNTTICTNGNINVNGAFECNNATGDQYRRITVDLSSITALNNNASFGVRIVAAHFQSTGQFRQTNANASVATGGTWRFDNVAVRGTSASTPTIIGTATATAFTTTYGASSAEQSFSVSGSNLTSDITATAPTGFEVSSDNLSYGSTATFLQSGGTASGTVYVRLAATAIVSGSYNAQNIVLSSTGATSVNITTAAIGNSVAPVALTISGINANTKIYDGNTSAVLSGTPAYTGLVNGESFSVTGTPVAVFADANVNTAITVSVTGYTAPSGNYTVSQPMGLTADITNKTITISGLTADNKVYDGNTNATLSGTPALVGVVTADLPNVTLGGTYTATFADPNIATNIAVTVTGYTISGTAAGNYSLQQPTGLTANISSAPLLNQTITFNPLTSVTYGDANFALTATASSGLPVSYSSSNPAVANVSGNTVTVFSAGSTVITASQAGDGTYNPALSVNQTLTVSTKDLSVSGAAGVNKLYDGIATASITGATLNGVVGSDNVSVIGGGNFTDVNIGTAKPIVPALTLSGAQAANYSLIQPTGLSADITALNLTISGLTANNKIFDGNTTATLSGTATLNGVLSADAGNVILSGTPLADFASAAVGNGIAVTVSGYTLSGPASGNYTVSQPVGLTANITVAPTTLAAGDIAIIGYTTSGAAFDNYAILVLKDLTSGTTFFVNDNEVATAGGTAFTDLAEGEASFVVNSGQTIPAGTVIVLPWGAAAVSTTKYNYSSTSLFGLGNNNEELYLYTAPSITATTPTAFIYYAKIGASSSAVPAGLTSGTTAISPSGASLRYATSGALYNSCVPNLLTAIANTATNWNTTGAIAMVNTDWSFTVQPTCPDTPPTIVMDVVTTSDYIDGATGTSPASPYAFCGVINDPTDPAATLGFDFIIGDAETAVGALTVTVSSSNTTVVPSINANLTGTGANRHLTITPAAVGYSTISIEVNDGFSTTSYVIAYAVSAAAVNVATTRFHLGRSDASTAVMIDNDYILVADDENQALRLYDRNNSGLSINSFDFTTSLGLTDISGGIPREVDIESSVKSGNRIYWLGSHDNSSSGANRPNRSRIFATDITGAGAATTLTYVGRFDNLKTQLIAWDQNNAHGLGSDYFGLAASAAVGVLPEATDGSGFNIEGLTFAPDNSTAYICFRSPISPASSRTDALIVPVTNFTSLFTANPTSATATFGTPILLNLGGRGIREIKKNNSSQYIIIAGPVATSNDIAPTNFVLYSWTGNPSDSPVALTTVLNSASVVGSYESIVDLPNPITNGATLQLIADNGDAVFYNDAIAAKDLGQGNHKKATSVLVTVSGFVTPPVITSPITASATQGAFFTYDITALNNPTSFASGTLPLGLSLSPAGVISGTPTVSGSFSISISASNAAGADTKTLDLSIATPPVCTNPPTVDAGADLHVCEDGDANLGVVLGGSATQVVSWTGGNGNYTYPNFPNLNNLVYAPAPSEAGSVVTLTVTTDDPDGAGPCVAATDQVLIIVDQASIVNAGTDISICIDGDAQLSASVTGGVTGGVWSGGAGTFSPGNTALNLTYTPAPSEVGTIVTLLLTATMAPGNVCPANTGDVNLTISDFPIAHAGPDQNSCGNTPVSLSGSLSGGATTATWSTSGNGSFSIVNSLNAVYTPSQADILNGSVLLTLTPDPAGVCNPVSDDVYITISSFTYYADTDGDGYGNAAVSSISCYPSPGFVLDNSDCNDANSAVNPAATEICNGIDDDCDGDVDANDSDIPVQNWYADVDGDGFGDASGIATISGCPVAGKVNNNSDCDDGAATVNPAATEICDAIDNDCDGSTDEGVSLTFYADADGDTYGNAVITATGCYPAPGYVLDNSDCNDANNAVNPAATEVCNGIDDDCDGDVDADDSDIPVQNWYADVDGDGFGDATGSATISGCPLAGLVNNNNDCDDGAATINPAATEICDAIDNDCDGSTDEGVSLTFYVDADGDTYGNAAITATGCYPAPGYVLDNSDCNDANSAVNPAATEICNGIDDDCDGDVDANDSDIPVQNWYADVDGDGFGDASGIATISGCPVAGLVNNNNDCDDGAATVNPTATEICDAIDNDCDGSTDEGVSLTFYADADGDTYGNAVITATACYPAPGYVLDNSDCNDANSAVNPAATEVCNGIDDDCDGDVDADDNDIPVQNWYADVDGDGFGDAFGTPTISGCPLAGKVLNNTDCDDNAITVYPGANEICDGLDNDCNGTADDGLIFNTWYADGDGDSYGGASLGSLCYQPNGAVSVGGDCNDAVPVINPGATEICANGIDEDCDGLTDEGCNNYTYYQDLDNDTYGNALVFITSSNPVPPIAYVVASGDCNDNNPGINPGAVEICNGIDDDCDGLTDEGLTQITAAITATGGQFSFCPGTSVVINADPNTVGSTYVWSTGATTPSVSVNTAGTYSVTITNASGCSSTASVTITKRYRPSDFNQDGITDVLDFLTMVAVFDQPCTGCPQDLNGNGVVNVEDFLIFLNTFGLGCN